MMVMFSGLIVVIGLLFIKQLHSALSRRRIISLKSNTLFKLYQDNILPKAGQPIKNFKLGISCSLSERILPALDTFLLNGIYTFRINSSHQQYQERIHTVNAVYQAAARLGIARNLISINLDIPSNRKFRISAPRHEHLYNMGDYIIFYKYEKDWISSEFQGIYVPHIIIFDLIRKDMLLSIDDGRLKLKINSITEDHFVGECLSTWLLPCSRKNIAFAGLVLPASHPYLSESDMYNISTAKDSGFTGILASFVYTAADVHQVRSLANGLQIHAKIETPSALDNLLSICKVADIIRCCRGDLAIELPRCCMYNIERRIVRIASKILPVVLSTSVAKTALYEGIMGQSEISTLTGLVLAGIQGISLTDETVAESTLLNLTSLIHQVQEVIRWGLFLKTNKFS
jgi:pyruvate kinase